MSTLRPDSSPIRLNPFGLRMALDMLGFLATELEQQTQQFRNRLAAAERGDWRGYLNSGLDSGYAAASLASSAESALRDALRNAGATAQGLALHDLGLAPALQPGNLPASAEPLELCYAYTPDLEERAAFIYERLEDDGFLNTSNSTPLAEIESVLVGLSPAEMAALQRIYAERYSPQRHGRDLVTDILVELPPDQPIERYQAIQLLDPARIHAQNGPVTLENWTEYGSHVATDPPLATIMTGTEVTFNYSRGYTMYDPHQPFGERRYVLADPSTVAEHGVPPVVELEPGETWRPEHPGAYTLVVEVRHSGEHAQYYTMHQQVLTPAEMADYYLQGTPVALDSELYLQTLELQIERLEQQLPDEPDTFAWEPADDQRRQIEQLRAVLENARDKLGSEPPPMPIQAVLTADASSEIMPLQLYLKPTADGGWAIVDLTNPDPGAVREYSGATVEEAWQRFQRENTLPAGQIAARPVVPADAAYQNLPNLPPDLADLSWNAHNDGQTTLQQWKEGLSNVSLLAGVLLAFALVVPGGNVPAILALGALSAGSGAAAAGLSTLDRAQHGNLRWNTDTALDLLDLAGSLAPGVSIVAHGRQVSVQQLGRATLISEAAGAGIDTGAAVLISARTVAQIQAIENDSSLTAQERRARKEQVLAQALQDGQAIILGRFAAAAADGATNAPTPAADP